MHHLDEKQSPDVTLNLTRCLQPLKITEVRLFTVESTQESLALQNEWNIDTYSIV